MRELIFVCQVFYPDDTSTSQLFTELLAKIAQGGIKVTVICGYPASTSHELAEIQSRERIFGLDIIRCGLRVTAKTSYIARAVSYFSFLAEASLVLLKARPRGKTVLGVTNPPFLGATLWLISKIGRFSYQYLIHDAYPEGLEAVGKLQSGSVASRVWRAINQRVYKDAEQLIVLGRDMQILFSATYGIAPENIKLIPNWSPSVAGLIPLDTAGKKYGLEDKFIVQYSGNMGLWHDIETFVLAAEYLRDHPKIQFLFIGGGIRRKGAQELAVQLGLKNILWMDFVPIAELHESLSCCHVSLITLRQGLTGIAVPCKLYGILATGRAIVAQVPEDSEIAFVVREEECGRVVAPGDVVTLAKTLLALAADPDDVSRMGAHARLAYEQKYTIEQAARSFRELWD